ncbi:MAG: cytochrome P460 family protein [Betaproteobacteria bacterium]|nr:cytochrome P460 family protein [Betaproteobacteria bacterium]
MILSPRVFTPLPNTCLRHRPEEKPVKTLLGLTIVLAIAPIAQAADVEAGKAKAATVCAACHGAAGVSVSDTIPNLAAQRAGYLEAQLKALKEGTRKNPIMNAIAAQLSAEDMANVAAYFASQPGAATSAKSSLLPNIAKSAVTFPEGYQGTFTKYHTINFPATRQVRYYYANKAAVAAAKAGKPLPDGSVLFAEVYAAKLGADSKPVTGADGFYVADKLLFYTAMARGAGWGKDIPEMLRNGDWNYAVFTTDKKHRPGVNQAECLACHKPLDNVSYTFTLKQLARAK